MSTFLYQVVQRLMVILAFLVFLFSVFFASLNRVVFPDLFSSSNGQGSRKYYNEVTPVPAAFFIIWPIIYIWNSVGAFYIIISVFLSEDKNPVNFEPTLIPITFLVGYTFAFGGSLSWLFAYDREILGLGLFLLIFSAVSLYVILGISHKLVHDNLKQLDTKEKKVMLWLVRILIQNGLALPATWLTIASCLNLTNVIIYEDSFALTEPIKRGISIENGSSVVLAVISFIIIVWFIIDNFVFEKYTRYTFTVYPVLILGLSGLVARHQNLSNQNLIFACIILSFCILAFIIRILLFMYRCNSRKNVVEDQKSKVLVDKV